MRKRFGMMWAVSLAASTLPSVIDVQLGMTKTPIAPRMWGNQHKPHRLTPAQRYHRAGKRK